MEYKISQMVQQEISLGPEEMDLVDELIPVKAFKAGTVLLEEGKVARDCYFTIEGCIRSYQVVKGDERTTDFFVEGEPVASLASYLAQTPANHYLACVEDSVLAVLNYDKEKELYRRIPAMESLCRVSIEKEFAKQQGLLQNYLTKNPEERYKMLQQTRPELLQRVPQYHLASFLGVQPESLSRIRKRIAKREQDQA